LTIVGAKRHSVRKTHASERYRGVHHAEEVIFGIQPVIGSGNLGIGIVDRLFLSIWRWIFALDGTEMAWGFRFIMLLRSGLYEKEGFALTWGVQYDEELFVCCPCFINEFFIEKNISLYDHLLRPKYTMHFGYLFHPLLCFIIWQAVFHVVDGKYIIDFCKSAFFF